MPTGRRIPAPQVPSTNWLARRRCYPWTKLQRTHPDAPYGYARNAELIYKRNTATATLLEVGGRLRHDRVARGYLVDGSADVATSHTCDAHASRLASAHTRVSRHTTHAHRQADSYCTTLAPHMLLTSAAAMAQPHAQALDQPSCHMRLLSHATHGIHDDAEVEVSGADHCARRNSYPRSTRPSTNWLARRRYLMTPAASWVGEGGIGPCTICMTTSLG